MAQNWLMSQGQYRKKFYQTIFDFNFLPIYFSIVPGDCKTKIIAEYLDVPWPVPPYYSVKPFWYRGPRKLVNNV